MAKRPSPPPARPLADNPRLRHGVALIGSLYRHQLSAVVGDDKELLDTAWAYAVDLIAEFQPRDPVERMLVSQMIQTHARTMYLNAFMTQQQNLKWAAMMNDAADRASNTFRRQMLALAEYRRPPRPARQFTAIGQANIAAHQVVQNNGNPENEKTTNEQGCGGESKALPPDGGRPGVAATVGPAREAMGVEHRAEDGGRQGDGQP